MQIGIGIGPGFVPGKGKRGGGAPAFDPDALDYITRVENADGEALEPAVKSAINDFVIGCKEDGNWNAIKAACILAKARTLSGALVPIKAGNEPTNFNFVGDDYSRITGLKGDGSTKLLNSNRNNNADPQNNQHVAVYISEANTGSANGYIGAGLNQNGTTNTFTESVAEEMGLRNRNDAPQRNVSFPSGVGFLGMSRDNETSFEALLNTNLEQFSRDSQTPLDRNVIVYGRDQTAQADGRIQYYSIGEALDLIKLRDRLITLFEGS